MQNSTSKEYGELITLQKARRKDTWAHSIRILMNTWHKPPETIVKVECKEQRGKLQLVPRMKLKASVEGRIERGCWENQQQKELLVVDLWITSQNYAVISNHKRKWLDSWEEQRNAKLHFKRIWRINCTSKSKKERYLSSFDKNLDEHLRNELNHDEPPWRTPVTKGWRDKIEGWKG